MKYYVIEGIPNGAYNASTKARNDAEKILEDNEFEKYYVETNSGVQKNKFLKWKQIIIYYKNKLIWNKSLSNLKKGDIVVIQYPIINTTINLKNVIKKYKNKGIIFVALIHDLDSLRYKPDKQGKMLYKRVVSEDKYLLGEMNYIIAHNSSMKKELINLGNDKNKIVELELFDYLVEKKFKKKEHNKNDSFIIAGNLSVEKAGYLSSLNKIKGVSFNLYGVGYSEKQGGKNISYKGKFSPEELLEHLEGSFGIVWDGNLIQKCEGGFGEYLKYNNPHKISLYITAGIPVVVWKKSALAKFVEENEIGIAIDNLENLNEKINKISEKQYKKMLENVDNISVKTKTGAYLSKALNTILNKIDK